MISYKSFASQLYTLNAASFENIAISLCHFQARHNPVYRQYIESLKLELDSVQRLEQIPFLPISFFKEHVIRTEDWEPEAEFISSGTTGQVASRHLVRDMSLYLDHAKRCFEQSFGALSGYHLLALLPSYLERKGSSLVTMIDSFIQATQSPYSGFYLHDQEKLLKDIEALRGGDRQVILWGVTFALLDLAEKFAPDLSHSMIVETGGMKGRRYEITRQELHNALTKGFNVSTVYSEYGMTEMLSQAYTRGGDTFFCPPSLKVLIRDITDPFQVGIAGMGGVNVIDLANIHSVAFLETGDIGKTHSDGSFQVMGRLDNSDVRGCNLLVE